ncbi:HesA/MoeB/ThiF family protein [Daejeonella lutea]|uniref:Molybdopterin-synthase adenylyltransferase n=1 Tax=Daejeonella lutea TaxID=572036 RepID=A0A1T4ZY07_9SPHI|nr:HesA/MoeB/ThiF family protein [Daejeonella lutea]SKB27283.1 adenylyltransferase and sulfurtransferase [Daejeonella lutea]
MENPRYQRQTSLKEFGEAGQIRLNNAKVLVIGAGGLGCPALQYLAGAGVGTIGIVDNDRVALSNLHRQVLYSTDDIGLSKALRAADILSALNPEIDIIPFNESLSTTNAQHIISQFDIILDGTDNFASRYLINDACVLAGKPLVYGAISRFEGQVAVFNWATNNGRSSNYRDVFPNPPAEDEILNCEEAGVIGTLPGMIGTMMANEAIKLIAQIGVPLINRLMTYNSLNNQMYDLEVQPQAGSHSLIPANFAAFEAKDYELMCSSQSATQIDPDRFEEMLQDPSFSVIDVRELNETPVINEFNYLSLPLSSFEKSVNQIKENKIVIFCKSGKRSLNAARILASHYGNSKKIYSLKGGILAWKDHKEV